VKKKHGKLRKPQSKSRKTRKRFLSNFLSSAANKEWRNMTSVTQASVDFHALCHVSCNMISMVDF